MTIFDTPRKVTPLNALPANSSGQAKKTATITGVSSAWMDIGVEKEDFECFYLERAPLNALLA